MHTLHSIAPSIGFLFEKIWYYLTPVLTEDVCIYPQNNIQWDKMLSMVQAKTFD